MYEVVVEVVEVSLLMIEDDNSNLYLDDISYFLIFSYVNVICVGDMVMVVGLLNYSFGIYCINLIDVIMVILGCEVNLVVIEGNLFIVIFNVLNYFNGEVMDSGEVIFDYDVNCGVEDEIEFVL